ncbi:TPA: hypothetical protein LVL12_005677 [Klebsiella oxytoca]|nr:hypothetical protein [Klebsiella oxytoca]
MNTIELNDFSSVSVRAKPGVYVTFPIVDNKGVFDNYTNTDLEDGFVLETLWGLNSNTYGIFEVKSGIKFLTCAFSSVTELNARATEIIFHQLPHMIEILGIDVTFSIHCMLADLPDYHYELEVRMNGLSFFISPIGNTENLTREEIGRIKRIPGALESIKRHNQFMRKAASKAHIQQ